MTNKFKEKFICENHVNNEIIFICGISQWHCEPLCLECIPNHNKIHLNNKSIPNIKKIEEMKEIIEINIKENLENFIGLKNKCALTFQNLKNEDEIVKKMKKFKADIIAIVEKKAISI